MFVPALNVTMAATGEPPLGVRVMFDDVIVDAFIARSKTTVTVVLVATSVAPPDGDMLDTPGGVVSADGTVVNVDVTCAGSGTLFDPCTPVVTVTV